MSLFQDYTHGLLLINLLFALSYFVCHNSFFFSVLVVRTVNASFRVSFSSVKESLPMWCNDCFCGLQPLWSLRLSLCYKASINASCSLYAICVFARRLLLQHNESVRFSQFLHSSVEKPCSMQLGDYTLQAWSVLTKPVTHSHLHPAAVPDIAGRWPNLAWASVKGKNNQQYSLEIAQTSSQKGFCTNIVFWMCFSGEM